MLSHVLALLLAAAVAGGADVRQLPPAATGALETAITAAIDRFNTTEEKLRDNPKVESGGPAKEPSLLRATYRRIGGQHQITGIESGATPVATVRMRAVEFEKRATNTDEDIRREFKKAPWLETPRGYILDFRFHWNGKAWEQVGEPASYPTLGVVGEPTG
jgi:hypothetical protein